MVSANPVPGAGDRVVAVRAVDEDAIKIVRRRLPILKRPAGGGEGARRSKVDFNGDDAFDTTLVAIDQDCVRNLSGPELAPGKRHERESNDVEIDAIDIGERRAPEIEVARYGQRRHRTALLKSRAPIFSPHPRCRAPPSRTAKPNIRTIVPPRATRCLSG
jgi:hypothetical protein